MLQQLDINQTSGFMVENEFRYNLVIRLISSKDNDFCCHCPLKGLNGCKIYLGVVASPANPFPFVDLELSGKKQIKIITDSIG